MKKTLLIIALALALFPTIATADTLTIGNCTEIREECIGRRLYTVVYNTCTDQVIEHRQVFETDRKTRSVALPVRCN